MVDIFIGRDFEMGRLWLNRIPADMDYLSIWNEYQLKYSHLKEKFLDISNLHITCTNLDTIKLSYNRDIYSKRVADDIKDLVGLLKVLENRSVLSYNKIKPLKEIATTYVKDPVLDKIIKDYEDQLHSYQTLPLFNVYKCRSEPTITYLQETSEAILTLQSNNEIKQSSFETIQINQYTYNNNINVSKDNSIPLMKYFITCIRVSTLVIALIIILYFITIYIKPSALATSTSTELGSTQPEHQSTSTYHETRYVTTSSYNLPIPDAKTLRLTDLQTKIFYRISENIGRYWRDLARILNVKEAEIDSIDLKDGAIKDKSFESLKIFLSRCESCNWQRKLIRSLEFIRRKDLAEMVEDLLTQNI
ncbi:uncharacterized protein LOC103573921 isoform X5 [Microplitis demolitor]|uniref:uncharacterized protein LOC103573921 isoform X5 n=1 Tax=Microplitis demolitor TaxID=69319 RepID=UPI0004CCB86C|nr:uncharacterized protein LOC103573921 isoform X5 [Microplitis demolitor]